MKNLIHTAVVTLFAASAAHAQEAVQWKVSDGGNGHWYKLIVSGPISWNQASLECESLHGHLATINDPEEDNVVANVALQSHGWNFQHYYGPWLGGYQETSAKDYIEPRGGWKWVTGEPWQWAAWEQSGYSEPNNCNCNCGDENFLQYKTFSNVPDRIWNDVNGSGLTNCPQPVSFIIEWDADCNNDSIVDYGQCRDGTLPDYNGNNIPDCCERGDSCVVGSYPVQWRVEDGGNGHWYEVHVVSQPTSWSGARTSAKSLGGDLASLESTGEPGFVYAITGNPAGWGSRVGPWLGGFQDTTATDYVEPAGGWRWTSGALWQFADWEAGEPNNGFSSENYLHLISNNCPGYPAGRFYNDLRGDFEFMSSCERMPISAVVEWSADCNNDGIVDYGQILQGQLVDANTNGIPDICQQPTCVDADLFRDFNVNGADLGILLSQWGPNTPLTVSDINKDGVVNGADLGIMLAFWGACPN